MQDGVYAEKASVVVVDAADLAADLDADLAAAAMIAADLPAAGFLSGVSCACVSPAFEETRL